MKTLFKKLFSVFLAVAVLTVSLFTGGVVISSDAVSTDDLSGLKVVYADNGINQTAPTQGTGTEADPYIIETASHLRYIAQKSTPADTYGKYYKVDSSIDVLVFQSKAYIDAVAGSLSAFLALDAEGVKAALSQASVTVGENTIERIQYQCGASGSSANSYDSFAGTIDFSGVTICGMYNKNGGLIGVVNGGATFKNLTLCNNYIESGWYNGNLVGYVHNGSATLEEFRPLTISNVIIHDCYQYTTANGWYNTGVLIGSFINAKNIPLRISNILTYDNISLGQKSSSDTTMMECALYGSLPSSWNGDNDGVANASYNNIVTLDCVPYVIAGGANNQSTKPAYWHNVYTAKLADFTPCNWYSNQWDLFDITLLSSVDAAKGTATITNMPKLDWENVWVAIENKYPTMRALHNFEVIDNGDNTHAAQCNDCGLVSAGCGNDSITTVEKTPATCTEAAWYYSKCTVCGFTSEDYQKGQPLDHNVQTFEAIAHTCTEDGVVEFLYCDRCFLATTYDGSVESTLAIDPDNYNDDDFKTAAIEAGFVDPAAHTATLDGGEIVYIIDEQGHSKICSICGENFDTDVHAGECVADGEKGHVVACDICGVELDEAVPHTFDENGECTTCNWQCTHTDNYVYNDAGDCETAPTALYICKLCGRQETVITGAIPGHKASQAFVENAFDATCTYTGSYESVVYCTVCDKELSREYKIIDKLPHTEGKTIVENYVKETCGTNGSYQNVTYCTVCGKEASRETVTIPATGHTVLEKDGSLVYSTKNNYHYTICAKCNAKLDGEACTFVDDICTVCGAKPTALSIVYANGGIQSTAPTKGSGTEADPYIIENPSHMRYIAQYSTPETTYGKYYKVDPSIDILVFQSEAYINAVAGSLDDFLALDAEGVKAALSQESVTVGENEINRITFQSGSRGSSASSYDGFAGNIDFSGVTICGMYNQNGGLIAIVNGGATLKNLTLCNNYIVSGWYNGNLVGYVHNGSATQEEFRSLTISNVVIHDCYQTTTLNGWSNTGVLIGSATNGKNIPFHISNILTYDNVSLGQKSSSDTTMMDCALYGSLPASWNGENSGVANASYNNIVTLDCVPYQIAGGANNQSTKPAYWSNVYTAKWTDFAPCSWNSASQWNLFDITKLSSADLAKGTAAKINMPKLDWTNVWAAVDGAYPELQAFHCFEAVDNGDGTHTTKCNECGLVGGVSPHTFINGVCLCGYNAKCGEIILFWDGSSDSTLADNGEAGTAADPIIIDTAAELNYLVNNVSGSTFAGKMYYKMADGIDKIILQPESIATVDIDANGVYDILELADGAEAKAYFESITPVHWIKTSAEYWFAGTFDGNNTQFVGMYAVGCSTGLFPTADGGATFKNLAIKNSYIAGVKTAPAEQGYKINGNCRTGAIVGGTPGYKYGAKVGGAVTFENIIVANNYLSTERNTSSSAIIMGADNMEEAVVINNAIVYGNKTFVGEAPTTSFFLTNGGGTTYYTASDNTVPTAAPSISNVIVLGALPYNYYIKGDAYFTNVYTDMDTTGYAETSIKSVAGLKGFELAAACDGLDWEGTFLATDGMPEFYCFHRATITDNGDGTHNLICTCGIENINQQHVWNNATCVVCGRTCAHSGTPEFVVKTQANCTSVAIGDVVCATCKKVLAANVESGELGSHNLELVEGMEPTCTDTGYVDYYLCNHCKCVFAIDDTTTPIEAPYDELILAALGHTKDTLEFVEGIEPNCSEFGFTDYYYCAQCDSVFKIDDITTPVEEPYDGILLPALGHTEGEAVVENEVAATCTEKGSYDSVIYCELCGKELSRETLIIDEFGHTESERFIENMVDATCTEKGSYDSVSYCETCGDELSRETLIIDEFGHTESERFIENMVDATCTENGSYDSVSYCETCGDELSRETVIIYALGHSTHVAYNETAHWDACTVCGEALNETEHTMTDTTVPGGTQSSCNCGYTTFTANATDESGNAGVNADEGAFPVGTEIIFELINEMHGHFEAIKEILQEISSKFVAYDITPSNPLNDGKEAELCFVIPQGFSSNVAIYYVNEQTGELVRLETEIRGGKAHAKTRHFSTYVLVDENTEPATFVVETDGIMVTGSTITVQISAINNPGIISTMLELGYDTNVLEFVSAEGVDFVDVDFGPSNNVPLRIFWADALGENHTDGVIATLTFNVKADATIGDTEIWVNYDAESTFNYDLEYVTFQTQSATAKVVDYLVGDVNDDGEIDMIDTTMMMRYILGWDIEINTNAADVNADGIVNNMDYVLLGRFIAGWDVELKYLY